MTKPFAEPKKLKLRHYLLMGCAALRLLIVSLWRPLLIAGHRLGMDWAASERLEATTGRPPSLLSRVGNLDSHGLNVWYHFHRDSLVSLGALVHRNYQFAHVTCPSDEAAWLEEEFIAKMRPQGGIHESSCRCWRHGSYAIHICVPPDRLEDWDAWHRSFNGPGLMEKAMAAERPQE